MKKQSQFKSAEEWISTSSKIGNEIAAFPELALTDISVVAARKLFTAIQSNAMREAARVVEKWYTKCGASVALEQAAIAIEKGEYKPIRPTPTTNLNSR